MRILDIFPDAHVDGDNYATIPYTTWGDYIGSVVERANARYLDEEFPDVVSTQCGAFDSEWLVTPTDAEIPDDLEYILIGLKDYPCVDEDLMYEIEAEIFQSDWDTWLYSDIRSEFLSELEPYYWDSFDPLFSAEDIEHYFYCATDVLGVYWECESATSGYVPDLPRVISAMAIQALADLVTPQVPANHPSLF
jgi:hypothetical protein